MRHCPLELTCETHFAQTPLRRPSNMKADTHITVCFLSTQKRVHEIYKNSPKNQISENFVKRFLLLLHEDRLEDQRAKLKGGYLQHFVAHIHTKTHKRLSKRGQSSSFRPNNSLCVTVKYDASCKYILPLYYLSLRSVHPHISIYPPVLSICVHPLSHPPIPLPK